MIELFFLQNCFAQRENLIKLRPAKAEVAELVDALGLGSSVLGRAGSIPVLGISLQNDPPHGGFFLFYSNSSFSIADLFADKPSSHSRTLNCWPMILGWVSV